MNFKELKYCLGRHWHNIPGWRTNRKIVVFESDDWGSIRMPSKEVYNHMIEKGYPLHIRPFEKFDSLESETDIQILLDTLSDVKDKFGNNALFTMNFIMTNPDFDKIRASNFETYYDELFIETYNRYYGDYRNVFNLIQKGINEKLIYPQYHGYSHFNYLEWMESLKKKSTQELLCFDYEMVGIPSKENPDMGNQLMIALSFRNFEQYNKQKYDVIKGVKIFTEVFGFKSKSFIAPAYTWNSSIEEVLASEGIKYIQSCKHQKEPLLPYGDIKIKKHILGEKNRFGQLYLIRNIFFEPATNFNNSCIDFTLKAIESAFLWKKPAIISTHRLNYIGRIHPENREKNINLLKELLKKITCKWPDVEFLSSDQLGLIIEATHENSNS